MILRDKNNETWVFSKISKSIFGLTAFVILALVSVWYFAPYLSTTEGEIIYCDAEKVRGNEFISKGYHFQNGKTQSSEQAYSGRYSCKLDSVNNYGMTVSVEGLTPGQAYKASVFRFRKGKTPGALVVSGKDFYLSENRSSDKLANGWELIELFFNVPLDPPQEQLKFYVHTPGHGSPVYFDDLKIEPYSGLQGDPTASFKPLKVELGLEDKALRKLERKRQDAFRQGLLISEDDDWVNGKIKTGDENVKVKLRLKGDWMDHLQGNKWSFRVKVKDPQSWQRMKTVSFQNPKTRYHLREWVFHEFLENEDILSPRYDFMELSLGGESLGVYAYEEHFDKQLAEYKHRREGPIIRFVEDAFWLTVQREFDMYNDWVFSDQKIKTLKAAEVKPFKEGKTANSEVLSGQFRIAQSLMYDYKNGTKPVEEIFDIERLAKYYALVDLNQAYHGLTWINQRMYYNPVTSKLEPIGYDGFGEQAPELPYGEFIGEAVYKRARTYKPDEAYRHLFYDETFVEKYLRYLYEFTEPSYHERFFQERYKGIVERERFIKKEFTKYEFGWDAISEHALTIRQRMLPFNNVDVLFKAEKPNAGFKKLSATNYHYLPVRVIGFGNNPESVSYPVDENGFILPNPAKSVPSYSEFSVPEGAKIAFFKLPGVDSVFHSRISIWDKPLVETPAQELFKKLRLPEGDLVAVHHDSLIVFGAGKHKINSDIIIPEGYTVSFEAGLELDMTNKSKFISRSPVFMAGTEDLPIKIFSSDRSANGFTVLQAGKRSKLTYVHFDHLNTLNDRGWVLTGAVNFYESDVDISHTHFTNNHCEDGLNIIRSNFLLDNSVIAHTFSDGFDADFCTGKIKDTYFNYTGNDGMDMSGSLITVENCVIENAGDKGISVGEEATIHVKSADIDGAVIGIASKDLSKLTIDNINLKRCQQGIAAYQKKPEYGGSKIEVKNYSAENVKFLHLLEPGSVLILKGRKIEG